MDHRLLLKKYIEHVNRKEGSYFLNYRPDDFDASLFEPWEEPNFTDEEWAELEAILAEIINGVGDKDA